jgi:hypothetical protein
MYIGYLKSNESHFFIRKAKYNKDFSPNALNSFKIAYHELCVHAGICEVLYG